MMQSVVLDVDGTPIATITAPNAYTTSWNSSSAANGTHSITSFAYDSSGPSATSAPVVVTVSASAPTISAISAAPGTTDTIITWTTNTPSSSKVNYGLTSSYGSSTTVNNTPVTSHSVLLTGLAERTLYHFQVVSANPEGRSTPSADQTTTTAQVSYYLSPMGSDTNNGTSTGTPWQTMARLQTKTLYSGDSVSFQGGQSFTGCLALYPKNVVGTVPEVTPAIVIGSYGTGEATINANCPGDHIDNFFNGTEPDSAVFDIHDVSGITIHNLIMRGNGPSSPPTNFSSTEIGVFIRTITGVTDGITIEDNDIGNFMSTTPDCGSTPKRNCDDYSGGEVLVEMGISVAPNVSKHYMHNINVIGNTLHGVNGVTSADDGGIGGFGYDYPYGNMPPYTDTHSITNVTYSDNTIYDIGGKPIGGSGEGVGIVFGGIGTGEAEGNVIHDIAYNSIGKGEGPVGIETGDSSHLTIKQNEAYNVLPGPGMLVATDFDGFDADIGTNNTLWEQNYSHDNRGFGYLAFARTIAQGGNCLPTTYDTCAPWGNNTWRYNIAENNDLTNSDTTSGDFQYQDEGCDKTIGVNACLINVYNNTIAETNFAQGGFSSQNRAAMAFAFGATPGAGSVVCNNLFIAGPGTTDDTSTFFTFGGGRPKNVTFCNNDYYNLGSGTFRMYQFGSNTYTTFPSWQVAAPGHDPGSTTDNPFYAVPATGGVGSGVACGGYNPSTCPLGYILQNISPLAGAGLDLTKAPYSLSVGSTDFFGNTIPNAQGTGYNIGAYGRGAERSAQHHQPVVMMATPP